ncbi:MAG: hypothetical protein DDT22_01155 [candidate division WS2 bacterium]|nr:hypothetical protein [Candidatus Lithacetigena glycinireducens]
MSILASIPVISNVLKPVFDIIDKAVTDKDLAQKLKHEIMLADYAEATAEMQAKRDIVVAELEQSDTFTKRARPSVVYVGLGAIVFNYCFIPFFKFVTGMIAQFWGVTITIAPEPFDLPSEFWWAWGGVLSVYVIGRSTEKVKGTWWSKLITGGQKK